MKLYYAETKDKKATLAFEGETLVCNNPRLFEFLIDINNKTVRFPNGMMNIREYNIIEVEANTEGEETT